MALDNINYAVGQDTMLEAFDKINTAIDRIDSIYDDGQMPNGIETDGTLLKTKVVQIGDWDMASTQTKNVAHGVSNYKNIRSVSVIIRDDTDAVYTPFDRIDYSTGVNESGSVLSIGSTNIQLARTDLRFFDTTAYDSTSYNRGFVTITYEA